MRLFMAAMVMWIGLAVGCDFGYEPAEFASPEAEPEVTKPKAESPSDEAEPQEPASVRPKPERRAAAAPPVQRKQADVGDGRKGHYGGGIVRTPLETYFRGQELINFKLQIPNQMKMFKAINDRAPESHEEFMEEIIKPLRITLPQLHANERYIYDPKTEQLMIETKRR